MNMSGIKILKNISKIIYIWIIIQNILNISKSTYTNCFLIIDYKIFIFFFVKDKW